MRIAIVDDLAEDRTLLRDRLTRQLCRRQLAFTLSEFTCGEDFLAAEKKQRFDAAFLDVYMTGMNGIDTARQLRNTDTDCLLIFTTTSLDHALEGFQVRAMQYLVKPYTEEDLERLTEEILERLPRPDKYMDLKVNGSDIRLRYGSIVYAEHFAHMINIHTTAGKILATRQPFKDFTQPLKEDPRFFVCGRGTIVNLEHAADFADGAFRMDGGSKVYVNRELSKNARQAFMEFLLRGGTKR